MKTYTITDPQGNKHTIQGPEGATREQVIAKVQERLSGRQQQQQPDAYTQQAQKQSVMQNLLAGAGGGLYGLYLGGKQMLGQAKPEEIEEHKRAMAGLRSTTAGTIGDIAGQVAASVPAMAIPGANTYIGSGLIGAGLGALQPTRENESVIENAMLGAAGGAAGKYLGDTVGKVLGGSRAGYGSVGDATDAGTAGINDPVKDILKRSQKMGFKVTPGQASGSKSLQQFEAKLESQPMTSSTFNAIKDNNQKVLNRAAAKAIGESSDSVDSAVLSNAKDRISGVYKIVADDKARVIPADDFIAKMAKLEDEFEGMLPGALADNPLVKRLVNFAADGKATGEQLQNIASKLGKVAQNQMTTQSGDRQLGMALYRVKDMADDYLEAGLKGQTKKAFSDARAQYRNLMLLTQRGGVVNPATGDVSGNALASVLQQKDKAGYLYGGNKSDMYDAARFAQAFKPLVGNSGTATRSMVMGPTDALLSLPFNAAVRAYTSSPVVSSAQRFAEGLSPELAMLLNNPLRGVPLLGGVAGANINNQ